MRHLILAAVAAIIIACAPAQAAGHNRALYRSHCTGAWCWVTVEAERPALELRKRRPRGWRTITPRQQRKFLRECKRVNCAGAAARPAIGIARVCTAAGRCARVAAQATSAFQGLIRDLEAAGYAIGTPGCLSRGHMRNSKHHWGGACDLFDQVARNRTRLRQPSSPVQIEIAARHGLTSGCAWRHPDCGHFEVLGRTYARAF